MKPSTKPKKIRVSPPYTVDSQKNGNGVVSVLLQLLLLYIAVVATVTGISTGLSMSVTVFEVAFWCLLFTALAAVACYNKITAAVSAGAVLVGGLICMAPLKSFITTLTEAVRFCYDLAFVIMKMRGWNYTSRMLTDEAHIAELLEDETLVMSYFRSVVIVLAVFYAVWFVAWSWKRARVWPTVLVALAVHVPGFTIGLVPSIVSFSMLLAAAFGLYVQSLSGRKLHPRTFKEWLKTLVTRQSKENRFAYSVKSGLYGICTAGVSLALMLLVALFTYQTPVIELQQVREYLDEGSKYVYNQLFYSRLETPDNAIGNMIEGETLDVLKIPNIHKVPVFYMKSEKNQTVYLRAWVSDAFTDEGWTVLNEADDADYKRTVTDGTDPYGFAAQTTNTFEPERLTMEEQESFGFVTDDIELKARFHKSLIAHLPSYGTDQLDEALSAVDSTAGEVLQFKDKRPAGNKYTVQAFVPIVTEKGYVTALHGLSKKYSTLLTLDTSDINSKNFQTLLKQERSYYKYAQKHFLSTAGMTGTMKDLAKKLATGHTSELTKVLSIEQYFRNNKQFTYTLKPQKLLDVDKAIGQVEYSLFSQKEGYCTYYATAMTLMVRSLGYPARYVNGYYVDKTDHDADKNGTYHRTVMDENCHAWVEVYFNGIGWMPFDPTPDKNETDAEFSARYYALELEKKGGEDEDNAGGGTPDIIMRLNFAEQPDDNEQMPDLHINYGIFGGIGLIVLLLIVLLLFAVVAAVLLLIWLRKSNRNAEQKYLYVRNEILDGRESIHQMYKMMLKWLRFKKIVQHTDETAEAFAERVDQTLQTDLSLKSILPLLQRAEFSDEELPTEVADKIRPYFDELYRKMCQQKGGLNRFQKMRI